MLNFERNIRSVKFQGVVEIDESLFGRKVKYNKGKRSGMKVWIFGLGERYTNRLKLFPVHSRNKATLMKIIQENVEKG